MKKKYIILFSMLLMMNRINAQIETGKSSFVLTKEKLIQAIYTNIGPSDSIATDEDIDYCKIMILINDVLSKRFSFYSGGEEIIFNNDSICFQPIDGIFIFDVFKYVEITKIKLFKDKAIVSAILVDKTSHPPIITKFRKIVIK